MSLYDLPKIDIPKIKLPKFYLLKTIKNRFFHFLILVVLISFISGLFAGIVGSYLYYFLLDTERPLADKPADTDHPIIDVESGFLDLLEAQEIIEKEEIIRAIPQIVTREQAIIQAVEDVSPAVVSIVVTKDLPVIISPFEGLFGEPFFELGPRETERREVGWGSGFIVSANGLILTNRHVVLDEAADYTVVLNDGREFPAKVLARDRVRDLAVLKIETEALLPTVKLGDSANLRIGQTVIAIGNVLGEFQNSISVGVISGLGRTITARGGGLVMRMEDVIQTDAAINQGNSGGPLLNLKGEVIGINTAMVFGAENIGFAIPVNQAGKAIEDVKKYGRIIYPFLGVRYVLITERIQRENNLAVDYGVWVIKGRQGQPAVFPGSAAEKAGIREGDIILRFNQEKITPQNSLVEIIVKYNPGDRVVLKILRDGQEKTIEAILGEHNE